MEDDSGEEGGWDLRMGGAMYEGGGAEEVDGGDCLITNKTLAAHRPAEAPAIRAVT